MRRPQVRGPLSPESRLGPCVHGRAGGAGRRRGIAQNGTSSRARLEGLDGGELAGSWWASSPSAGAVLLSRWSSVTGANRKLAATSSASTSTSERRWPSGVSQDRALRRPTTTQRAPLRRLLLACSAWSKDRKSVV